MNNSKATIKYKTADGNQICVEVSTSVKELLSQSDRQIRSQRRQDRRYLTYTDFIDNLTEITMKSLPQIDPANLLIEKENQKRLWAAVDKLPTLQRQRLILHFVDGLTHRQISNMQGVNRATISHSIERALKQLRKLVID